MKKKLIRISARQSATAYTLLLGAFFTIYLLIMVVLMLVSGQAAGLGRLLLSSILVLVFTWLATALMVWASNKVLKKMGGIEYETIDSPVTPMQ